MDTNNTQEVKEAENRKRHSALQSAIHQNFASLAEFGGDGTVEKFLVSFINNLTNNEPSKMGTTLVGRIHAIKQVRVLTGFGLCECKTMVERLQERIQPTNPKQSAEIAYQKERSDDLQARLDDVRQTNDKLGEEYGELEGKYFHLQRECEALKTLVKVYMNREDYT